MDIGGGRIDFWNDDFVHLMLGKKVYFRYDPENLSEVRIYDLEDRYIMSVPADNTLDVRHCRGWIIKRISARIAV